MTETHHRRVFLATLGSAVAALPGCGEPRTGDPPTPARGTETADGTPDDTGAAGTAGTDESGQNGTTTVTETPIPELDLREANVVGVGFEQVDDGRYSFDVTLIHNDDGEDGYANWWQVEALDGARLGRRELSHAHGTQEFTRSAEVDIPAEDSCVVVRGHDQTHEYGGQAMLVNLDAESVAPKRQGSERQSFTEADCPG